MEKPDPLSIEERRGARAIEMARVGKRERIVRVDEAPGQPFDHGIFEIVVENQPPSLSAAAPSRGLP